MKNVTIDDWDWCIDDETRLEPWFRIYREVEEKFTVKADEMTRVFRAQDSSNRSYMVKHVMPNSIREHLIAFFTSRARNIYESSVVLRQAGIPCVEYCGWAKDGTDSMLLSVEIPGTVSALEYWFRVCAQDSARRQAFVTSLASLVSDCVVSSIVIPELTLENFLVSEDGSEIYFLNPLNAEKTDGALSKEERLPYLHPFVELRGEISAEPVCIALQEAGFAGGDMDISEILHEQIGQYEDAIEEGSWPDEAAHVLSGEGGPLYRIVQKENSTLRIRNTIWYSQMSEPDDTNSQEEVLPAESAEEAWVTSFKMQLLRFHCSPLPLSWEQFEDGRNIVRYATTYSDLQSCGFNQ